MMVSSAGTEPHRIVPLFGSHLSHGRHVSSDRSGIILTHFFLAFSKLSSILVNIISGYDKSDDNLLSEND